MRPVSVFTTKRARPSVVEQVRPRPIRLEDRILRFELESERDVRRTRLARTGLESNGELLHRIRDGAEPVVSLQADSLVAGDLVTDRRHRILAPGGVPRSVRVEVPSEGQARAPVLRIHRPGSVQRHRRIGRYAALGGYREMRIRRLVRGPLGNRMWNDAHFRVDGSALDERDLFSHDSDGIDSAKRIADANRDPAVQVEVPQLAALAGEEDAIRHVESRGADKPLQRDPLGLKVLLCALRRGEHPPRIGDEDVSQRADRDHGRAVGVLPRSFHTGPAPGGRA